MALISLTTDLGNTDFYVAKLKSAILKRSPEVSFLDVSHAINYHDIQQAAFYLQSVWQDLPEGSIHMVNVYTHYSTRNEYIVFQHKGHFFIGPNNGIFSLLHSGMNGQKARVIDSPNGVNNLFDLFGHAAACVIAGLPVSEIGALETDINERINILPVYTSNEIRATIIHVDHFGNVILNLEKALFEKVRNDRNFEIYFKRSEPITAISSSYSHVAVGDVAALFNINGNMELAINMGNASTMLDLFLNETIQIHFKN